MALSSGSRETPPSITWVGSKPIDAWPSTLNCPGEGKTHVEQGGHVTTEAAQGGHVTTETEPGEMRPQAKARLGPPVHGEAGAAAAWGLQRQRGPAAPRMWAGGLRNRETVYVCCLEPPGLWVLAERPAIRIRGHGERPQPRRVLTAPRGQYSTTPFHKGHRAPLPSSRHRKAPRILIHDPQETGRHGEALRGSEGGGTGPRTPAGPPPFPGVPTLHTKLFLLHQTQTNAPRTQQKTNQKLSTCRIHSPKRSSQRNV